MTVTRCFTTEGSIIVSGPVQIAFFETSLEVCRDIQVDSLAPEYAVGLLVNGRVYFLHRAAARLYWMV